MPTFSYCISPDETPLTPESPVWSEPLPLARPTSGESTELVVSHGEYFDAVRTFVELDDLKIFAGVLAGHLQQAIEPPEIQQIRICLEKHGEFYHPARIETDLAGRHFCFVLNVAISDTGKNRLNREFYNLKRLNTECADSFLPRVYITGEVASGKRSTVCMFLGEWFNGYHEFHISRETTDNRQAVCVWDEKNGRYYLSNRQSMSLYRKAARIMTAYYNVSTFEHISPWHHAAGDFIVKNNDNEVDLKLITVRGYVPLFQQQEQPDSGSGNVEQIMQALLIFLLKLSIRMRLDRIDGVGDIVWLNSEIVPSTLQGVFDALALKAADPILPDAVDMCFQYYLSNCRPEDLFELSEAILPALGSAAPEVSIIKQNLAGHVRLLVDSIREI